MYKHKSVDEIAAWFDVSAEIAANILDIGEVGYYHGKQGWYPNGDYSSDADWCYGTGEAINKLELQLEIDDGSIFDFYIDAHGQGLTDSPQVLEQNMYGHCSYCGKVVAILADGKFVTHTGDFGKICCNLSPKASSGRYYRKDYNYKKLDR